MKILLIGATGTLGRQIAKQAVEQGHEVRCFVRNPKKASFLQEWGCELTRGNLLNSSDIEYALQDVEAVVDAATSRPDDSKSIYETDWEYELEETEETGIGNISNDNAGTSKHAIFD